MVEQPLAEPLGIHARLDPAEQACWRCGQMQTMLAGQAHTAAAGGIEPGAGGFGMAPEPALLQAQRKGTLRGGGGVESGDELGVEHGIGPPGRADDTAHAPARGHDLGKAGDVEGALQSVERGQPGTVRRRKGRVAVVLDEQEVVCFGQLKDAVCLDGREAVAGGVVQHRDERIHAWPVACRQLGERLQVDAVAAAGHRQEPYPHARQTGVLHRPAGRIDEGAVAGAQQGARHHIERMGRAGGGDDLRGTGLNAQGLHVLHQHGAQQGIALGAAVQGAAGLDVLAAGAAQGAREQRGIEPFGWQHARGGRGLAEVVARHGGRLMHGRGRVLVLGELHPCGKHGADERAHVVGHASRYRFGGRGAGALAGGRGAEVTHIEAALAAGLDEAAREQLVVGGHHGVGAHAIPRGGIAHRGQASAGGQQPGHDALSEQGGKLVGQCDAGLAAQDCGLIGRRRGRSRCHGGCIGKL